MTRFENTPSVLFTMEVFDPRMRTFRWILSNSHWFSPLFSAAHAAAANALRRAELPRRMEHRAGQNDPGGRRRRAAIQCHAFGVPEPGAGRCVIVCLCVLCCGIFCVRDSCSLHSDVERERRGISGMSCSTAAVCVLTERFHGDLVPQSLFLGTRFSRVNSAVNLRFSVFVRHRQRHIRREDAELRHLVRRALRPQGVHVRRAVRQPGTGTVRCAVCLCTVCAVCRCACACPRRKARHPLLLMCGGRCPR
jgi:hypothetical protein